MNDENQEVVTEQTGLLDQDADATENNTASDDNIVDENENNNEDNEDSGIYGSPENYDYSKVELPEGMALDQEMVDKFNPLAKKYNLSNDSANELMKLAVELVGKNTPNAENLAGEIQKAEANAYLKMLNTDKELCAMNEEQYGEYINLARLGVNSVATNEFKQVLKAKGLSNHPAFIKTFYQIGKMCNVDKVPTGKQPVTKQESAADILYGKKD